MDTTEAPVKKYVIEMAVEGSTDFKQIATVDANKNKIDIKGLKDGQRYSFRIRGQNQAGTSPGYAQLEKPVIASVIGKNDCQYIVGNHSLNLDFVKTVTSFELIRT